MTEIVLINPLFETSYWGLEHALPLIGKKSAMPPAGLLLLAALTPRQYRITVLDENVEPLDFDRLARADIVGVTGMSVQRRRMFEILDELQRRSIFTVVGGPWASVQEADFADRADVVIVGEADQTWPQFLADWQGGRHQPRYEQTERTDLTTLPPPRLDLVRMKDYLFGSLQLSRGCPFQCEFCDIIVTFGRKPRHKTCEQVVAELDQLRAAGAAVAFVVDDNLIGNKKAIRPLLAEIAAWQKRHGYPMILVTEASLDLAEQDDLMQLMVDANFVSVFVGIESPNEESLRETRKSQNIHRRRSLPERVETIQAAGLEVWAGLIVGFDHDDASIFEAQREFARRALIPQVMVGMLSAIPKTPLYDRLLHEDRLDLEGEGIYGTNVVPLGMSREALRDGYVELVHDLYEPREFFDRLDALFLSGRLEIGTAMRRHWRSRPLRRWIGSARLILASLIFVAGLSLRVEDRQLRKTYQRRIRNAWRRRDPLVLFGYSMRCVMHYHHYRMARDIAEGRERLVNTY